MFLDAQRHQTRLQSRSLFVVSLCGDSFTAGNWSYQLAVCDQLCHNLCWWFLCPSTIHFGFGIWGVDSCAGQALGPYWERWLRTERCENHGYSEDEGYIAEQNPAQTSSSHQTWGLSENSKTWWHIHTHQAGQIIQIPGCHVVILQLWAWNHGNADQAQCANGATTPQMDLLDQEHSCSQQSSNLVPMRILLPQIWDTFHWIQWQHHSHVLPILHASVEADVQRTSFYYPWNSSGFLGQTQFTRSSFAAAWHLLADGRQVSLAHDPDRFRWYSSCHTHATVCVSFPGFAESSWQIEQLPERDGGPNHFATIWMSSLQCCLWTSPCTAQASYSCSWRQIRQASYTEYTTTIGYADMSQMWHAFQYLAFVWISSSVCVHFTPAGNWSSWTSTSSARAFALCQSQPSCGTSAQTRVAQLFSTSLCDLSKISVNVDWAHETLGHRSSSQFQRAPSSVELFLSTCWCRQSMSTLHSSIHQISSLCDCQTTCNGAYREATGWALLWSECASRAQLSTLWQGIHNAAWTCATCASIPRSWRGPQWSHMGKLWSQMLTWTGGADPAMRWVAGGSQHPSLCCYPVLCLHSNFQKEAGIGAAPSTIAWIWMEHHWTHGTGVDFDTHIAQALLLYSSSTSHQAHLPDFSTVFACQVASWPSTTAAQWWSTTWCDPDHARKSGAVDVVWIWPIHLQTVWLETCAHGDMPTLRWGVQKWGCSGLAPIWQTSWGHCWLHCTPPTDPVGIVPAVWMCLQPHKGIWHAQSCLPGADSGRTDLCPSALELGTTLGFSHQWDPVLCGGPAAAGCFETHCTQFVDTPLRTSLEWPWPCANAQELLCLLWWACATQSHQSACQDLSQTRWTGGASHDRPPQQGFSGRSFRWWKMWPLWWSSAFFSCWFGATTRVAPSSLPHAHAVCAVFDDSYVTSWTVRTWALALQTGDLRCLPEPWPPALDVQCTCLRQWRSRFWSLGTMWFTDVARPSHQGHSVQSMPHLWKAFFHATQDDATLAITQL